jgi:GrpB-like predicted nucleotidyltransferase (UPF0157 family)
MVLCNSFHVERILFELFKNREAREDDADNKIVVRELDVAWIKQFGQEAARLLRVVRLQALVLS